MARSRETYGKKEVRNKKEKKRKAKEERKQARKDQSRSGLDDMIAYVGPDGELLDAPADPAEKEEIDINDIAISTPKAEELSEEEKLRKGVVTFFNEDKGYGFIKDTKTNESFFVHVNNVNEDITTNNMVTFEVQKEPRGLVAVNVSVKR
ncbi:MAG: DNA-binding protein [Salinivirgaceae bacterium]|nr:MAG: DNA-binding protein [Salinivirgaceae bacterium]